MGYSHIIAELEGVTRKYSNSDHVAVKLMILS
jgi:hypothetical protein